MATCPSIRVPKIDPTSLHIFPPWMSWVVFIHIFTSSQWINIHFLWPFCVYHLQNPKKILGWWTVHCEAQDKVIQTHADVHPFETSRTNRTEKKCWEYLVISAKMEESLDLFWVGWETKICLEQMIKLSNECDVKWRFLKRQTSWIKCLYVCCFFNLLFCRQLRIYVL